MSEVLWVLDESSPELALNYVQFKEGSVTDGQVKVAQSHLQKKENEASYVKFKCTYEGEIENNTYAEYLDYDGNIIISGRIKDIIEIGNDPNTDTKIYEIKLYDKGIKFNEANLNQIFEANQSPEDILKTIVEDLGLIFVDNQPTSSGLTLLRPKKYIDRNPIDAIDEMCQTIGASWRVDGDFFIIYRKGEDLSSEEIDANNNWKIPDGWEDDTSSQCNRIILKGATILQRTSETLTGTGTVFYTTRTPENVEIEGLTQTTETIDGDYEVFTGEYDDGGTTKKGKIVFETSKTDPVVEYSYNSQIRVEKKVGAGDITKEVQKTNISSAVEARSFANNYLEIFKDGISLGQWVNPYPMNYNVNNLIPGNKIKVTNVLNPNRDGEYIISKVERRYPKELIVNVGEDVTSLIDWQSEAKERIKQLAEKDTDSDFVQVDESLTGSFDVSFSTQLTKLFTVEETGEILFASETPLTNLSDMIYDTGSEPADPDPTPMAVDDDGLSSYPDSYTDLLAES